MNGTEAKQEPQPSDTNVIPPSPYTEPRRPSYSKEKQSAEIEAMVEPVKKESEKSFIKFLYDAQSKKILGRSAYNWGK